jgi:NADPH:quinone reductase-like Zn-dependent oxidoreductase
VRVIQFSQFGDPSQLQLVERPGLKADEPTAVIRIVAASVNPSDVKNVAGRMHQTTLPGVPGRDYSGVVVDGPAEWIGKEVWGTGGDAGFTRDGSHAEFIAVLRSSLVRKPERLSHEQAGSGGVTFVTAWCAVNEYARLQAGETIAIIDSRGGVGHAAAQIAKHLGARVIGVNRIASKASNEETPIEDLILDSSDPKLPDILRSMNDGRGADVVLNAAGGPVFEIGLSLLAHRGRQVEITSATERRVAFDLVDFYHNESQLIGLDTLKRDLDASARIIEKLLEGFRAGAYRPHPVGDIFPLEAAREAYERVSAGSGGRVVLKMVD